MFARARTAIARLIAPELRSGDVGISDRRGWEVFGGLAAGSKSAAGVDVSPSSALGLSAAYAAINAIATDVASLPLRVYRRRDDGGRDELRDHVLDEMLNVSPDGETTAMRWRQALIGHALGWGNGYAELRYTASGALDSLRLLDPRTDPRRRPQDGHLYYQPYRRDSTLPPRRVLHVAGLGFDGLKGYCPVTLCRQTVGLSLAADQANGAFLGNGSRPGGVIEWVNRFRNKSDREAFRSDWNQVHRGPDNAGAVVLLEPGMKYVPITINPEDAQFLETRQFQVTEIARLFRVPPHKLMDYSQAQLASAGIEASNIDYMTTTLMPWCEAIEQELNRKLLTPEERAAGMFVEHHMQAFLRGDMKTRAEYYRSLRDLGALNPNEIRRFENMNPLPDGKGETYLVQGAMVPIEQAGAMVRPGPGTEPEGDDDGQA